MYRMNIVRVVTAFAVCFAIGLFTSNAKAQNLPKGKDVLAKFVKATGGLEKYKKVKSRQMKGKLTGSAQNITADMSMSFVAPDKFHVKVDLGGIGTESQTSDGKTVWATSTIQGDRIVEGEEADRLLESVNMKSIFAPEEIYKEMKTVGQEKVDGEDCYKVEMTRKKGGDKDVAFYSVKTGLQTKSITKAVTPLGKIEVSVKVSDYKEVDGIKSPHKMEQSMAGVGIEIKVDSIKYNGEVDKKLFEMPDSIKKLVDKKNK